MFDTLEYFDHNEFENPNQQKLVMKQAKKVLNFMKTQVWDGSRKK